MEDQSDLNIILSSGGCVNILFLSSDQLPYREMIDEVLPKKKKSTLQSLSFPSWLANVSSLSINSFKKHL